MILINGASATTLPITDRAFQYGDGCFTTMLVKYGEIQHWSDHLARLKRDTQALAIDNIDWQKVNQSVTRCQSAVSSLPFAVIKVLISRGIGGKGYSPLGCMAPTSVVSVHDYPTHYLAWQTQGVRLALLQQRLGLSPLAKIKHLNRLEQVLLKRELATKDAEEGVACCLNGHVVETTCGNLFWRKGLRVFTPLLDQAGVLGTQRAWVIKALSSTEYRLQQVQLGVQALLDADEIFICNALMELVPVKQIEQVKLTQFSLCNALMSRLNK